MTPNDPKIKKPYYLCVHGHFYQPPRENPWLEMIEVQKSAFPYHDWNDRITRECYGPNTRSRLHGENGRIAKLINNYEYMSFDFGPTLLSWLEIKHPWIYSQILAADKAGQKRYNGHGNALAHVYNHIIMPLATYRDKLTQIRWGLADFRHRFHREPEGMWLAETAVDMETLGLMADEGIRFTVLSPLQASSVRSLATLPPSSSSASLKDKHPGWMDVSGARIDPTRPYRVFLNNEHTRFIDVFFYDDPLSRSIAYEKVLSSGEALLGRIKGILENHKDGPRILSIATDGESYGHHFKFGEMALSWLFEHIEKDGKINLTNFGAFLELSPPKHEVKIVEHSSWSCAHGTDRWRADCSCSVGGRKDWNQKWRTPLRDGLDWLAKQLSSIFEKRAGRLLKNPWDARDEYLKIILDESSKASFFNRHAVRPVNEDEKTEILCLLESQRMSLYMFTSCGWFFDDISGIESIQILMYALRAIELVRRSSPNDLEKGLREYLSRAISNDPSYKDGARIFDNMVKPSRIQPSLAAAHYAVMHLIEGMNPNMNPFSEMVRPIRKDHFERDDIKAVFGEVTVTEKRTSKETQKRFLAVREKGKEFICIIGGASSPDYDLIMDEISKAFSDSQGSIITVFSMMAQDVQYFSVEDLIPDVRMGMINGLAYSFYNRVRHSLDSSKALMEETINAMYQFKEPTPTFLNNIFRLLFVEKFSDILSVDNNQEQIDFEKFLGTLNLFQSDSNLLPDDNKISNLLKEILSDPLFKKTAQDFLIKGIKSFSESKKIVIIKNMINFLKLTVSQGIDLDLWECQNIFYEIYNGSGFLLTANPQNVSMLKELGHLLGFITEGK